MIAAFLKPASRSPYAHSSGAFPIRRPPSGAAAKSSSVHFTLWTLGRGCDPRVRHRAEEQLGEQHPVGAVVFRVLGPSGHLGHEIERRVVLADQLLVRHVETLANSVAPMLRSPRVLESSGTWGCLPRPRP